MHHVYYGQSGKLHQAPMRYLAQARQTWHVLRQERPEVVLVQNPPIFCAMMASLYARQCGAKYLIDSHTAAFLSPKWRWSLGLHRVLSRRALTTIVTNKHLKEAVDRWGCHSFILGFTPAEYPPGEPFPLKTGFNVALISTGAEDEPLEVAFEAASRLRDVNFYVTGNANCIPPNILAIKPDNCYMTGYLSNERYIGLLRAVDVVMDLTTRDHTLLLGAFEAVSLGTPLIVSDWPVLRDYFSLGTVHVPNTAEGIYEGVCYAKREHVTLQQDILRLRDQLHADWKQKFMELQHLLAT
jgi:glycosyltransferase involved in cell wall biosynthesis